MAREDAFKVEGRIVEVLSDKTFREELANGHRLLGLVAGKRTRLELACGDSVALELSPYDLSEGRIVGREGCRA